MFYETLTCITLKTNQRLGKKEKICIDWKILKKGFIHIYLHSYFEALMGEEGRFLSNKEQERIEEKRT